MTIPREEKMSLEWAENFLIRLIHPKQTPRVPSAIRREARQILRHYPVKLKIEALYKEKE